MTGPRRWDVIYTVLGTVLLAVGATPGLISPWLLPGSRPLREGQLASLITLLPNYLILMVWVLGPYILLAALAVYGIYTGRFGHALWIPLTAACATAAGLGAYLTIVATFSMHRPTAGALTIGLLPIVQYAAASTVAVILLAVFFGLRLVVRGGRATD